MGDWNSVTTNGTAQTRTHCPTHELLTAAGSNVSTDVKGNITVTPASLRPISAGVDPTKQRPDQEPIEDPIHRYKGF